MCLVGFRKGTPFGDSRTLATEAGGVVASVIYLLDPKRVSPSYSFEVNSARS